MAKRRIARPKATTGRETTVFPGDFKSPDDSRLGFSLQQVAATLTLIDDLECDALQVDYSKIGEAMGLSREDLRRTMLLSALELAGQQLAKAREALHDLFHEVELKPKAPKAVA